MMAVNITQCIVYSHFVTRRLLHIQTEIVCVAIASTTYHKVKAHQKTCALERREPPCEPSSRIIIVNDKEINFL